MKMRQRNPNSLVYVQWSCNVAIDPWQQNRMTMIQYVLSLFQAELRKHKTPAKIKEHLNRQSLICWQFQQHRHQAGRHCILTYKIPHCIAQQLIQHIPQLTRRSTS